MFGKRALIVAVVTMILAAGGTHALAAESRAVDPKTGCQLFFVSDTYTLTGAGWTGPVVDGKAEGKGTVTLVTRSNDGREETRIQGEAEMAAGRLDGKAGLKYSDGASFDGTYKSGLREGKGTYLGKNISYAGEWKNGKFDGRGIYKGDGQTYDGDWKEGKRDGTGTFQYMDGSVYEGEWKDNKRHGRGVFNNKRSEGTYVGEYRNGHEEGKGKITFLAGVTYEGDFKSGSMDGQGVYRWPDGRTLTGAFQNGQPHGFGVLRDPGGKVEYEGEYIAGKRAMKAE